MKNIAKLTSYGCYLDCDFVTAKYPGDETHIVGNVAEYVYDLEQKISDLEAKLEESEKKLEGQTTLRKMMSDESNINLLRYIEVLAKNEQLKQQLEEKEKEYKESVEKILSSRDKLVLEYTQDKISFAVEQLEKVKELVEEKGAISSPFGNLKIQASDVSVIIDNQTKQLKE